MKHNLLNVKSLVWCLVAMVASATLSVSCVEPYDDTEIKQELEQIKGDIASLRESIASELESLRELIDGLITVKSVEKRGDGTTVVILSNDEQITIYPKGEAIPENLITVVEGEDGVLYWAMYDARGNAHIIEVDGNGVPVLSVAPQMRVNEEQNAIEISFDGGVSWIATGYGDSKADALIAGIEVVYSEWQVDSEGEPLPLYCLLQLTDGSEVKVGMNSRIILDADYIYAAAGSKGELTATAEGAVDFVATAPQGWSCEVELNDINDTLKLSIGAPSSDAITSGSAVGEGVVKLYVVFDNGLSAIASIAVSTTPIFVTYNADTITITTGGGVESLLCGLVPTTSFTAAAAAEEANKVLAGGESSMVYSVEFGDKTSVDVSAKDINSNIEYGVDYTFWYVVVTGDEEQRVAADEVSTSSYASGSFIDFKLTSASLFDVEIEFTVKGSAGFIVGCSAKADFSPNACLKCVGRSDYPVHQDMEFKGSILELLGAEEDSLNVGTDYVFWSVECGGKSEVSLSDFSSWRFSTKAFERGGDLELEVVSEVVERTRFSVKLTSKGHIYHYYAVLTAEEAASYATDEALVEMLLSNGVATKSSEEITIEQFNTEAGQTFKVVAVAVDADGKLGKLFAKEYTTKLVEFNNLALEIAVEGSAKLNSTTIKATSEGATGFAYMSLSTRGAEWKRICHEDLAVAEEFMVLYSSSSYVHRVGADGVIKLNGLDLPESVVVVAAEDANGVLSHAKMVKVSPEESYGNIVARDAEQWAAGKPKITLGATNEAEMLDFVWYVTPAEGTVAYTFADTQSGFESLGIDSADKLVKHIVSNCDVDDTDIETRKYGHRFAYHDGTYCHMWTDWTSDCDDDHDNYPDLEEYRTYYEENLVGGYNFSFGGKNAIFIYTTWVDTDGNFHEPMVFDPATGKEVELVY